MWNDVEYLYKIWYNYVKLLGNKNLMERNFITNQTNEEIQIAS